MTRSVYRALWAYPVDLIETNPSRLERVAAAGIGSVSVAAVYHPFAALLPDTETRGPRWAIAAESLQHFPPTLEHFDLIQPIPMNGVPAEDAFARLADHRLEPVAWIVVCNSSLAKRYPEEAVRLFDGTPHPSALCPARQAVRAYACALVADAVEQLSPSALDLESLGWPALPTAKVGVPTSPLARYLLGVCVCDACVGSTRAMRSHVHARLRQELRSPEHEPLEEAIERDAVLREFQSRRESALATLIADISRTTRVPIRLIHFGDLSVTGLSPDLIATTSADVTPLTYGSTSGGIEAEVGRFLRALEPSRLTLGLSACYEDARDPAVLSETIDTARALGVDAFSIYNLSLFDDARLDLALHVVS